MEQIKLIFMDIDGTIAMPGDPPSPALIETLRELRQRGVKVFLSTGRSQHGVPEQVKVLELDGGIYSAGARIVVGDTTLYQTAMEPDLAETAIEILSEHSAAFTLECVTGNYHLTSQRYMDFAPTLAARTDLSPERRKFLLQRLTGKASTIAERGDDPICKVSFLVLDTACFDEIRSQLPPELKMTRFDNLMEGLPVKTGEISQRSINKGDALRQVCRYYGVTPAQCAAFGDSMNDAEILEAAGLGVAMGNSGPDLKAMADAVCGPCREDGLAIALREMILDNL